MEVSKQVKSPVTPAVFIILIAIGSSTCLFIWRQLSEIPKNVVYGIALFSLFSVIEGFKCRTRIIKANYRKIWYYILGALAYMAPLTFLDVLFASGKDHTESTTGVILHVSWHFFMSFLIMTFIEGSHRKRLASED